MADETIQRMVDMVFDTEDWEEDVPCELRAPPSSLRADPSLSPESKRVAISPLILDGIVPFAPVPTNIQPLTGAAPDPVYLTPLSFVTTPDPVYSTPLSLGAAPHSTYSTPLSFVPAPDPVYSTPLSLVPAPDPVYSTPLIAPSPPANMGWILIPVQYLSILPRHIVVRTAPVCTPSVMHPVTAPAPPQTSLLPVDHRVREKTPPSNEIGPLNDRKFQEVKDHRFTQWCHDKLECQAWKSGKCFRIHLEPDPQQETFYRLHRSRGTLGANLWGHGVCMWRLSGQLNRCPDVECRYRHYIRIQNLSLEHLGFIERFVQRGKI